MSKFFYKKILKSLCAASILLLFCFSSAFAASGVPTILSYQGRLTDASGNLLGGSGATYYVKFSLWNNPTVGQGAQVWPVSAPTAFATTVRNGVFNVNIGDTANGYPDALDYNFSANQDVYLQVQVSSDDVNFETLSPRQRIDSAAFAQVAGAVSGAGQSTFGTTTPINNSVVSVVSTSTNSTALTIGGFLGQLADLFDIQNYAGSNLFSVGANGSTTIANLGAGLVRSTASGNLYTDNTQYDSGSGTTGQLAIFNSANGLTSLATGTPGQVLTASSTSPTGYAWTFASSSSATVSWGAITGNISDQSDLQNEFNQYLSTTSAAANYLTQATAASTYASYAYASSTFPSFAYASATFATLGSLGNYLTAATAASTYQPIGSYVTNTYASSTFASTTFVTNNFPTFGYASSSYYLATNPNGYITSSALSPYLTSSSAASTYLSQLSAASTYVPFSYSSSTFPSFNYASSTFAALTGANFSGNISANNFSGNSSGTNTGDVTLSSAAGLTLSGQVLSVASSYTIPLTASTTAWNNFLNASSSFLSTTSAAANYVPFSYASTTFPTFFYSSSTFPNFTYASSTYATQSSLANYLTSAIAASTYETQSAAGNLVSLNYASSTFASTTYVIANYVPYSYASSTFPTFTYGSSTYALAGNTPSFNYASSTFVNYGYGSSTYALANNTPSYAYASSTFASTTYLNNNFPNYSYASSTYYLASNPASYITASALAPYLSTTSAASIYETQTAAAALVPFTYASSTFNNFAYSSSTFVNYSYASNTFATAASLGNYLTTTSAASTYETQSSAANLIPYAYGSSTFALLSNTPTYSYASSTFPSFGYASSTYYLASNPSNYISNISGQDLSTANNSISGFITNAVSNLVNYPTFGYASSTYALANNTPTYSYASSTFVSFPYATGTFATISSLGNYLTTASAASTYNNYTYSSSTFPSFAYGTSTYLSQATAASTYQPIGLYVTNAYASSTFPSFGYGSSTYATQSALGNYLTTATAATTYPTYSYASSSFVNFNYATNTFLTIATAASTYQPLLTNPITGTGNINQLAYFNGAGTLTSLATGTPGQFLEGSSTSPSGYAWAFASSGSATVAWGAITGNISDQSDLQNEFNQYLSTTSAAANYISTSSLTATLSSYLTSATAASTYQPIGSYITNLYASSTFPSFGYGSSTYALAENTPNYSYASSTYYLASNPSNYISNISGQDLSTANNSISGFITNAVSNLTNYPTYTYASSTFASAGFVTANFIPYSGATSGVNLNNKNLINVGLLAVATTTTSYPFIVASSTGASMLTVLPNGNVGIGTSTPQTSLDVNGNLSLGTNGVIQTNGSSGLEVETRAGAAQNISVNGLWVSSGYSGNTAGPGQGAYIQGKVGIGTTSPIAKLEVYGSGTAIANFASSSNQSVFYIAANGNIGIGTTTPATALSVIGTSTTQALNISNLANALLAVDANGNVIATSTTGLLGNYIPYAYASSTFDNFTYSSSTFPSFSYASNTFATAASLGNYLTTATAASTYVPYSGATGNVNLNNEALANVATLSVGSATAPVGGVAYFNGNVGIGSSTPAYPLTITNGNVDINQSSTNPSLLIGVNGTTVGELSSRSDISAFQILVPATNDSLLLQSNGTGLVKIGNGSSQPLIVGSSNVGIGTTTPSTTLSVVGTTTTSGLNISNLANSFLAVDKNGNVIATSTASYFANYIPYSYASSTFANFAYGSSTYYLASNPSNYISNISGQDLSTANNSISGFITASALSPYLTSATAATTYTTFGYASSTFASTTYVNNNFPTFTYASTTYVLPVALNAYLTTASAASTYVPYNGANAPVNFGNNLFTASGTSTLATTSATKLSLGDGLANSLLAVDANGNVIATSTINLLANLVPYSYASSTFDSFGYSSSTFPSFGYASSTYYLASNPSSYITASALSPYLTSATAASTYQPIGSYVTNTYASSTFASTSGLIANYVPYTGANTNVNLGANNFAVSGTSTLATTTFNGYIGINTANPQNPLDLTGNEKITSGSLTFNASGQPGIYYGTSAGLLFNASGGVLPQNTTIGTTTVQPASLYVQASSSANTNPIFVVASSTNVGGDYFTVASNGKVQLPLLVQTGGSLLAVDASGNIIATSTTSLFANYIPYSYASSTFNTFAYSSSTFPSFSYATSTYLSQVSAAATYLTQTNAGSTYETQTAAAALVPFSYGSSTYALLSNTPTYTYASSSFVNFNYATNTFLTIANGASTYVPYSGATGNVNLNGQNLTNISALAFTSASGTAESLSGNFFVTGTSTIATTTLSNLSNTFLAVNNKGQIIATTTPTIGGVTSVALSAPVGYTVSGSPVTTSGTLTFTTTAGYTGAFTTASTTGGNVFGLSTTSNSIILDIPSTTGSGTWVQSVSPSLTTPILGVASGTALSLSNNLWVTGTSTLATTSVTGPLTATSFNGSGSGLTGTAASLTSGNVTTDANLSGVITSSGNVTSITSQTGTGSTFVVQTSPTLVTPILGIASGTALTLSGNFFVTGTSTLATTSASKLSLGDALTNSFLAVDQNGNVIATTSPLSVAIANATYPTFTYGSSTYATQSALGNYLTTATAATTYVPYSGATGNVNLGSNALSLTGEFTFVNASGTSMTLSGNSYVNGTTTEATTTDTGTLTVIGNTTEEGNVSDGNSSSTAQSISGNLWVNGTSTLATTSISKLSLGDSLINSLLAVDQFGNVIATSTSGLLGNFVPFNYASSTFANYSYGSSTYAFANNTPNYSYASSTYYLASNPSNYITASALSPYLTSATAASTYQPIGSYVTNSYASSTFNNFAYSSSTFPSFSYATSTYLSQVSAAATYLTQTNAGSTYETQTAAAALVPFSYGSSTYALLSNTPTYTYASSSFVNFNYATNTFLTIANGASTYVPYSGATGNVNLNGQNLTNISALAFTSASGTAESLSGNFFVTGTSTIATTTLSNLSNTFLAVNNKGQIIATTTPTIGGVTSVALSAPVGYTVSGSPVTTSGTLTFTTTAGYTGAFTTASTTGGNVFGLSTTSNSIILDIPSTTGSGTWVQSVSPSLTTPILGVASGTALSLSNNLWVTGTSTLATTSVTGPLTATSFNGSGSGLTGTAASLTSGNVTTDANLSGVITSSGNVTSITSQTGTGSTFVVQTSPTLVTPILGIASGTALTLSGNFFVTGTSTLATTSASKLSLGDALTNSFLAVDQNGNVIATTSPLSVAIANATYPTFTYGSSTYATQSALGNYLTTATAATTYVPYSGATGNVNLGSNALSLTGEFTFVNASGTSMTLSGNSYVNGTTTEATTTDTGTLTVIGNTTEEGNVSDGNSSSTAQSISGNLWVNGTSTLATTSISKLSLGDSLINSLLAVDQFGNVIATSTSGLLGNFVPFNYASSTFANYSYGSSTYAFANNTPNYSYASSTYYLASNPSNYITASALSPYLTSATAASTYQPIGSYVTNSYASSTFNNFAYSSSTFPSFSYATSTYLSQVSAAATYLTQTNAGSTYETQTAAAALVPFSYGSSTYALLSNTPTYTYASSSFVNFNYATNTFLTIANGASTYVPYSGATGNVNLNNEALANVSTLSVGSATAPSGAVAYFNGNVSVGTTTSNGVLTVANSIDIDGTVDSGNGTVLHLQNNQGTDQWYLGVGGSIATNTFSIGDSSNYRFFINSSGNVGIGTSSPQNNLHIYTTTAGNGITIDGNTAVGLTLDTNNVAKSVLGLAVTSGQFSTDSATGDTILRDSAGRILLNVNANGTSALTVTQSGDISIGTTTPSAVLYVMASSTANANALFTVASSTPAAQKYLTVLSNGNVQLPLLAAAGGSFLAVDQNGNIIATTSPAGGSLSGGTKGFDAEWTSANTLTAGKLIDNGTVLGVNASSSSYTFNLQANAATNPFNIASSSGASYLTVLANGNVGIGTTNPTHQLEVENPSFSLGLDGTYPIYAQSGGYGVVLGGTSTYGGVIAGVEAGTQWTNLIMNPNGGNVGIGTTNPLSELDVATAPDSSSVFDYTGGGATQLTMSSTNLGGTSVAALNLQASKSGNALGAVIADIPMGGDGSSLGFFTNPDGNFGNLSQQMTILDNGNVGIGTTTPTDNLSVVGSGGTVGVSIYNTSGDTGFAALQLAGAGGTNANWSLGTNASNVCGVNSNLCFINNDGQAPLTLQANGYVGIGTTSPNSLLSVGSNNNFTINGSGEITNNLILFGIPGNDVVESIDANTGVRVVLGMNDAYGNVYTNGNTPLYFGANNVFGMSLSTTSGVSIGNGYYGTTAPTNGLIVQGNLGIGTSTPTSLLSVVATTIPLASPFISFNSSTTPIFNITAAGLVSIGADATPDASLEITKNSANDLFDVSSAVSTSGDIFTIKNNGDVGVGTSTPLAELFVQDFASSTSQLFEVASTSGESYLHVMAVGNVGIGTSTPSSVLFVVASSTANHNAIFTVASTSASANAYLTVLANGNVGIGTTTPAAGLTIALSGANPSNPYFLISRNGDTSFGVGMAGGNWLTVAPTVGVEGSGGNMFNFGNNVTVATLGASLFTIDAGGTDASSYLFQVQASTTNKFVITGSGFVGIGTSSPLSMLSVTSASTTQAFVSISATSTITTGSLLSLAANGATVPFGLLNISGAALQTNLQTGAGSAIYVHGGQVFLMASSTTATTSSPFLTLAAWYNGGIGTTTFSMQNLASTSGTGLNVVANDKLMFSFASSTSRFNVMSLSATGKLISVSADVAGTPDLAENIPVSDPTIGAGDIVMIDPNATTTGQYDTYAGSTYDLFSAKKTSQAYDPGILGVISTEPGILMHASIDSVTNGDVTPVGDEPLTLTGRTLVKVNMENGPINEGDYITSSDIPGVGMKATKAGQVIGQALQSFATTTSATSTGEILVFVNSGYYNGESISDFAGVQLDDTASSSLSKMVLSAFLNDEASTTIATTSPSELLVDRIAAGVEIITPQITANGLTVDSISSLNDAISFMNDTIFFGRPYFNTDTAGFALIHQGQQSVQVTFTQPYLEQPIVNATISLNDEPNDESDLAAAATTLFSNNVQYIVTQKSTTGFTILLNEPAPEDINFSWTAFAVNDAKTFSVISQTDTSDTQSSASTDTSDDSSSQTVSTSTATSTDQTSNADSGDQTSDATSSDDSSTATSSVTQTSSSDDSGTVSSDDSASDTSDSGSSSDTSDGSDVTSGTDSGSTDGTVTQGSSDDSSDSSDASTDNTSSDSSDTTVSAPSDSGSTSSDSSDTSSDGSSSDGSNGATTSD